MPVLLECVLENCARGVVGCDSKEWVFALSGLEGAGVVGGGKKIFSSLVWDLGENITRWGVMMIWVLNTITMDWHSTIY